MKISEILKAGAVTYTHHYMQTMVGEETCTHTLHPPKQLLTLAARHHDAEVVEFGDGTLEIHVGGNLLAAESPHKTMRPAKSMPNKVWQYCTLAMGGDGDTHARRH